MSRRGFQIITCALFASLLGCGGSQGAGNIDAHAHADSSPGTIDAPPGAIDARPGAIDAASGGDASTAMDPGAAGSYAVYSKDGTQVTTPTGAETITIFAPSSDGGATIASGKFPLVVVSTGYMIGRAAYVDTCNHLASWGYVVISHDYASGNHQDHAAGVSAILDWALGASSGLATHVDATRIATAGHSMGGKVSILTAILDPRVKAVVGWDPVDALPPIADGSYSVTPEKMSGLTVPIAVLGETTDGSGSAACAPSGDNYHQYFTHACAAPAALEVTITGADHTQFVDSASSCGLACLFCTKGTADPAAVLQITRRVTVAWFEEHLRGTPGMATWLAEPAIGSPTTISTTTGC